MRRSGRASPVDFMVAIEGFGRNTRMELSFWAATDVGKKREHNEDNFLVDKKLSLFVVADGMGGHASGEVASHIAVHEFRNAVEARNDSSSATRKGDGNVRRPGCAVAAGAGGPDGRRTPSIERGQAEPDKRGMGTTVSALLIAGDRGFIAHVGDSRIYMLRAGQVVAAHRGPLAHQRAHPARKRHQGGVRHLPLQGLQERGHAGGRRLRDGPGRHHRLRAAPGRPVPALLGRAARLPERHSGSSTS